MTDISKCSRVEFMPYNSDVPKIKVFFIFYDRSHSYWWWGKQKLSIYKSNSFLKIVYNNQFWSNPESLGTCIFFFKGFHSFILSFLGYRGEPKKHVGREGTLLSYTWRIVPESLCQCLMGFPKPHHSLPYGFSPEEEPGPYSLTSLCYSLSFPQNVPSKGGIYTSCWMPLWLFLI